MPDSSRSYNTYRPGNLFNLRIEKGLCPDFQMKLEHCRVEGGEPQLSIQRGVADPDLEFNQVSRIYQVSDEFQAVVISLRKTVDEVLVSEGRYEVVRDDGVYEISPGNLTVHG
ncbi:MAG: hypothetical protein LUQ39_06420, partial [Methanomassiliicoccales archaeon]|nr:hypothetical protein [Methanomassiliicoccales archaeon]